MIRMKLLKTSLDQFELMVAYMEQHGSTSDTSQSFPKRQSLSYWHWTKLRDLLNKKSKSIGEASRSIEKWKKVLADFKHYTNVKAERIKITKSKTKLSDLEKRLLVLMGQETHRKRKETEDGTKSDDDNGDDAMKVIKQEIDSDSCQRTPSSLSRYHGESETTRRRQLSVSSCASTSSSSHPTAENRKRHYKNNMKDITDKYIDFEKEREKMTHNREMARIKQNDQLITIFGRIVNVLESMAPSIQRCLDRSNNDS